MSAHSQKYVFFSPCLLYNHRVHGGEFRWGSVAPELSYSFSDVCLYIPEESLNKLPIQQPPPVSTSKGGNGSVSICKKDPHPDAENQQCYSEGKFFFIAAFPLGFLHGEHGIQFLLFF